MDRKRLESALRRAVDGHEGALYVAKQVMSVHGQVCARVLDLMRQDTPAHDSAATDDDDVTISEAAAGVTVISVSADSFSVLGQRFTQVVKDALAGLFAGAVAQAYHACVPKAAVLKLVEAQYDILQKTLETTPTDAN